MSKKGLKILTITFVILAVISLVVSLPGNKKKTGNFESILSNVESSDIKRIEILAPGQTAFSLHKSGADSWELKVGNETYPAEPGAVNSLLSQATKIKVKQVASKSKDQWENYHVNDSLGTILRLYNEDELVSALVAGRVTFAQPRSPYQQQPDIFSFVRPVEENIVYSTETMLSMTLDRGPETFRNPSIIKTTINNLRNISFRYPADSSYILTKADSLWLTPDAPADSATVAGFLNNFRNFSSRNFAGSSSLPVNPALFELILEGDNMEVISVKAWPGSSENEYLVISTQNEGSIFKLTQSQFDRIFKGKGYFVK